MRWDRLFADLESQAQTMVEADADAEIADQVRFELGRISLLSRLRAAEGAAVSLSVEGVGTVRGALLQVGADWLLLQAADEVLIPLTAVLAISDLPTAATSPSGGSPVSSRLRLTAALRAVVLERSAVMVTLRTGTSLTGTPERVGADYVDLALHEIGEAPRRSSVRGRSTVPFAALGQVRRASATRT